MTDLTCEDCKHVRVTVSEKEMLYYGCNKNHKIEDLIPCSGFEKRKREVIA